MGSVCAEHHHNHKFHHFLSSKKALQDLNIPPRKLLSRRSSLSPDAADYYSDSPSAALIQKFLPYNGDSPANSDDGFDPDSDPYSSDQFRMYEFKVRKCTRSRSHDWTDCPFAHPGEKARRRDPRRYHYSGTVCPEYRRSGSCARGDDCEFAHGVFECWLHPARYRTEACKDGKNCKRKVCFFAHSSRELRVLPAQEDGDERENCTGSNNNGGRKNCCRYCACALSPNSTLLSMSHFSPPMSPSLSPPFSPISRFSDRVTECGAGDSHHGLNKQGLSYQDVVIAELLGSLEGMSISPGLKTGGPSKGLWVDVGPFDGDHDHLKSLISPSTPMNPTPINPRNFFNSNSDSSSSASGIAGFIDDKGNDSGLPGPDLRWVNDLLM